MKDCTSFAEMVIKQTISDFYTPNIKAEVILDMLLTPYIVPILKSHFKISDDVRLITKELSIGHANEVGLVLSNRGKKVDYVAADDQFLYLVELKTTQGSLGSEQLETYKLLTAPEQRGMDFLNLLCRILRIKTPGCTFDALKNYLFKKLTEKEKWVLSKEDYAKATDERSLLAYTEKYQRKNSITGSHKYIHTVAEIVQNSYPEDWEKPIKIVYISPDKVDAEEIKSITFKDIASNDSELLKDFKESVLFTEIIKPLFL